MTAKSIFMFPDKFNHVCDAEVRSTISVWQKIKQLQDPDGLASIGRPLSDSRESLPRLSRQLGGESALESGVVIVQRSIRRTEEEEQGASLRVLGRR
jgi:hypothetical protein